MKNLEMMIEEQYSDITLYLNKEKNRRISVSNCHQGIGSKQMYAVRVIEVDEVTGNAKAGETVATRCTYDQAMRIAKEHYFK